MTRDTRELALATALQAYSMGAITKDDILKSAAEYETYLEGPTGSAGSEPLSPAPGQYMEATPRIVAAFTAIDLKQAGVANWNAALEELRDVVNAEDHWPWRDRLATEIERLKR